MTTRRAGSGVLAVVVVVALILLVAFAARSWQSDDPFDQITAQASPTTAAPPYIATAAPVLTVPAEVPVTQPPPLPTVAPEAYQLIGVVVDHDIQFPGTPDQRWVLQLFLRGPDIVTYAYVSEQVWKSCPVPGEFMVDRCVPQVSYQPELPFTPPATVPP